MRRPYQFQTLVSTSLLCPLSAGGVKGSGLTIGVFTLTGEPMKFLTPGDWTRMVEAELFEQTYRNYGLATVHFPVLEMEAMAEPFEDGRGFSLRLLRAGRSRLNLVSQK